MNVLMLGLGKGSFVVRGEQLGAALKARVRTAPAHEDLAWADVVVLIKQAGPLWASAVRAAGKPIVWDALDFWRQPEENDWTEGNARALLSKQIRTIRPALTIGATIAMAEACGGVYLPHHARPGLVPSPSRESVKVVAYEGKRKYLGRWGKAVVHGCARRGWQFLINPPDLRVADILIAFRDGVWDGWMCREWKSGVKVANARAAGRPLITQASAAVREEWNDDATSVIDTPSQLGEALDVWADYPGLRREAVSSCQVHARRFTLAAVAERYRTILHNVVAGVPQVAA